VLAGLWLLDGMLKLQPYMFTKNFAPMTLGEAGDGAPFWLTDPLDWAKRIVSDHPVGTMVPFALIEIAIGMAIAYRPALKYGLIGCLVWFPFLWFFAEGLGGLTTGEAISRIWGRATDYESDILHLAIGIAAAGLVADWARTLPRSVWTTLFALGCIYFAVRTYQAWADRRARAKLLARTAC